MSIALEALVQKALELGARSAGVVAVRDMVFDRGFRSLCESNACGNYGKSWMCPPDAGDIDALIARAKTFDGALVYQSVAALADSYDFEGMLRAGARHNRLARRIGRAFSAVPFAASLHLGAGGCRRCAVCAKRTGEPCRHPAQAMSSLEAYGIDVTQLAQKAGMRYISGANTVTYFGAYFYKL